MGVNPICNVKSLQEVGRDGVTAQHFLLQFPGNHKCPGVEQQQLSFNLAQGGQKLPRPWLDPVPGSGAIPDLKELHLWSQP